MHPCITDPEIQSQPEDGPHIGPKHVVVVTLLVIIEANIVL